MAKEDGEFDKNGLDVDVTLIDSSKGIPAVISGDVQVASLGGPETLSAVAGGADLVAVAVEGPVYPFLFQVPADIKTVNDLKGKKIGVSNFGSASDIATRLALLKLGLDPEKDVSILAVGSLTARIGAMQSGAIQGGLSNPPDNLALEAKGFHTLVDLSTMGVPASIANDAWQRSYVSSHRDVVQRYVDALIQAQARAKADKAAAVKVMKKYLKSDDDNAMSVTYDYFMSKVLPDYPHIKVEQYAGAQQILGKSNPKVQSYNVASMIDDSFVQNAEQRNVAKS